MMNRELLLLVDALSREKNVPKEIVFTALEAALVLSQPLRLIWTGPGDLRLSSGPQRTIDLVRS